MLSGSGQIFAGGPAGGNGLGLTAYDRKGRTLASFGGNAGIRTQAMSGPSPYSAGIQFVRAANGKITAGGVGGNSGDPYLGLTVRFTPAGLLDPSFGNDAPNPIADGIVLRSNFPDDFQVRSVALGPGGTTIVGGWTGQNVFNGPKSGFVMELNPDGSTSSSFGGGSLVPISIGAETTVEQVAVQRDGRILVGGLVKRSPFVIRLDRNGNPDTGFAVRKFPKLDWSNGSMRLLLQRDGRILLGGTTTARGKEQATVVRLKKNGEPDNSFAKRGIFSRKIRGGTRLGDLAVQDDGRIVVAGEVKIGTGTDSMMIRLKPNGERDGLFDGGVKIDHVSGQFFEATAVAVQPDRRILVGASLNRDDNTYRVVSRFIGDLERPRVKITGGPKGKVGHTTSVKIKFHSNEGGKVRFRCSFSGPGQSPKPEPCRSPFKADVHNLAGTYRFTVRETDPAGNVSRPKTQVFTVRR